MTEPEHEADDTICRIYGPGLVLVARVMASGEWYADGWDAARVAAFTANAAEVWRAEQIVDGGVNPLDDEQVQAIEAVSAYFALLARLDRREYVSVDEIASAIERLNRSRDGVIAEELWRL